MNPMTNMKNVQKLNEQVLQQGIEDDHSWHRQYKDSAYIFVGGLPYDLTEGDLLCVFSQYGEIVNINLVRDKKTGKQKGFCFICYEDQRSTILAVDNFNGIKLGGRTIRVDHCASYRRPLSDEKGEDGKRKEIVEEGCAPKTPPPSPSSSDSEEAVPKKKHKKEKKAKKQKKKKKKDRKEGNAKNDEVRQTLEKDERKYDKKDDELKKSFGHVARSKSKHENDFGQSHSAHKTQDSSHLDCDSRQDHSDRQKNYDRDVHRQQSSRDRGGDGYYRDSHYSSRRKDEHYSRKTR